jgi:hypothetical protein
MDEKPDQIMSHIESQRDQLGRNLNELESRVKTATDWRVQFNKNPMLMMGVALGGGMLLGSMIGGSRRSSRSSWSSSSRKYAAAGTGMAAWGDASGSNVSPAKSAYKSTSSPVVREQRHKANETFDNIKAALIGFATTKVKEFMSAALPGFNEHLEEAQRSKQHQGSSQYASSIPGSSGSTAFSGAFDDGSDRGSTAPPSYGAPTSPRTEQSSNSPYTTQGPGQNRGMNI